jgi:hypothetical protein
MAGEVSKEVENGQPTRRHPKIISKLAGLGLAATAAASLLTGCGTSAESKGVPSSSDVANGSTLSLDVTDLGRENVTIVYANKDINHLTVRTIGDGVVPEKFDAGASNVRSLGEITDFALEKVVGAEDDLKMYPKVTAYLVSNNGEENLPGDMENLYAIPVIMPDTNTPESPEPTETNANFVPNGSGEVPGFGQGLAVGELNPQGQFVVLGYLPNAQDVTLK